MFEECAPPIPVSRLIGRSGFGDAVGSVEAAATNQSGNWDRWGTFLKHSGITDKLLGGIPK